MNSQIGNEVYFEMSDILEAIQTDTITHMDEYVEFLEADSKDMVWDYMENYVHHKVYDTPYGDLLPLILANALCLNFIVISETSETRSGYKTRTIENRVKHGSNTVLLHKVREHYNGVVKKYPCSDNIRDTKPHDCNKNIIVDYNCNSSDENQQHQPFGEDVSPSGVVVTEPNVVQDGLGSGTSQRELSGVKICSWNINGLTQAKLSPDILGDFLARFDIILLCETWASQGDEFELEGYKFYNYPRLVRHHNAKRNSGGLGIFIKTYSRWGIFPETHQGYNCVD